MESASHDIPSTNNGFVFYAILFFVLLLYFVCWQYPPKKSLAYLDLYKQWIYVSLIILTKKKIDDLERAWTKSIYNHILENRKKQGNNNY